MENYKLYPMELSFVMRKAEDGPSVPSIVEEVLLRNVEHMINQQFKLFFSGFIFLSNLNPVDAERTKTALRRIFQDFVQLIEMEDSVAEEPKSKWRTEQVDLWRNLASSPVRLC